MKAPFFVYSNVSLLEAASEASSADLDSEFRAYEAMAYWQGHWKKLILTLILLIFLSIFLKSLLEETDKLH
jgi:hypothetical protein